MLTTTEMLYIGIALGVSFWFVPFFVSELLRRHQDRNLGRERVANFDAYVARVNSATDEELDQMHAESEARWKARGL